MKKLAMVLITIMVLIIATTAVYAQWGAGQNAFFQLPANTYNLPYILLISEDSTYGGGTLIYSNEKMECTDGVNAFNNAFRFQRYTYTGAYTGHTAGWSLKSTYIDNDINMMQTINDATHKIYQANYAIGNYYPGKVSSTNLINNSTLSSFTGLEFEVDSFLGNARIGLGKKNVETNQYDKIFDWEIPTENGHATINIPAEQVPYSQSGQYQVTVSDDDTVINTYYYTIIIQAESYAKIEYPQAGTISYYPSVEVKTKNTSPCSIYVNNVPIGRINNTATIERSTYIKYENGNIPWKIGSNTIKVIKDNGTVLDTAEVIILREDTEPTTPGGIIPVPPPPEEANTGTWLQYIGSGIKSLIEYAELPFKLLGQLINQLTESISDTLSELSGVSVLTGRIFSFLPPELLGLIKTCVAITVIFTVIKIIRG